MVNSELQDYFYEYPRKNNCDGKLNKYSNSGSSIVDTFFCRNETKNYSLISFHARNKHHIIRI